MFLHLKILNKNPFNTLLFFKAVLYMKINCFSKYFISGINKINHEKPMKTSLKILCGYFLG